MGLEIHNLSFHAGKKLILQHINCSFQAGQFISIIGPNGAGKSTLLKCLASVSKPSGGTIVINGQPLKTISTNERAKLIGYVPQHFYQSFPMTVKEHVMLGRKPYIQWNVTNIDKDIVRNTISYLKLTHLEDAFVDELSGGERQRTAIARALVQQPQIFMLDEPISALDINHQIQVLNVARELANNGHLVLVVLHDLELAARFSDELVLLHNGEIYATGTPEEVLTPMHLRAVYGVEAEIVHSQYGLKITVVDIVEEGIHERTIKN